VHSTARIHRQKQAIKPVSPINMLEKENIGAGRLEQRAIGFTNRSARTTELKHLHEAKPQFFAMDYQRIEQLKGKYMQAAWSIHHQNLPVEYFPKDRLWCGTPAEF